MVRTRAAARLAEKSPNDTEVANLVSVPPDLADKREREPKTRKKDTSTRVTPGVVPTPVVPPVSVVAPCSYFAGPSRRAPVPIIPQPTYDSRQIRHTSTWPHPSSTINQIQMQFLYEACKNVGNTYPIHPDVRFRRLPFFQHIAEVMKPSSLVPTTNSRIQEGTFYFHLTPQQAQDIINGPDMHSTQVQLRFCLLETSCEQDDCFPPSCSVKVNNKICQLPLPIPTNKTGVEPKRPPGPVNITALLKVSATVANAISVTWAAEYASRWAITVALVRKLTSAQLLNRLINKGTKNSDFTRSLIKEKLREDLDSEIATTSLRVSLVCPLGKMRMICPCRPTSCLHLQCFDASLFLQMNERKPTWVCPVCDKTAVYDALLVDGYFQDVLNSPRLAKDCSEIQLHKDGSWSAHLKKELIQEDFFNDTNNSNIEIINDDLDVIPLSDGSESSTGLPSLKRPATASSSNPDLPVCTATVDLTSDSEDDLPLKRKRTTPSPPMASLGYHSSAANVPVTFAHPHSCQTYEKLTEQERVDSMFASAQHDSSLLTSIWLGESEQSYAREETVKAKLGHIDENLADSMKLNDVENGALIGAPLITKAMAKQTSLRDYFKKRLAMESAARAGESFPSPSDHFLDLAVSSIISLDSPSPPASPALSASYHPRPAGSPHTPPERNSPLLEPLLLVPQDGPLSTYTSPPVDSPAPRDSPAHQDSPALENSPPPEDSPPPDDNRPVEDSPLPERRSPLPEDSSSLLEEITPP